MKNLKRALSFALASVMLIGMMVVGSSAVSFKDADEIEHTEAVNSMVALGLLSGRAGNFDPNTAITRAEMAKLICLALNGGKDPQLDDQCQFTDVTSVKHWAAGYIQYCVNVGVVSGRSATIFDPDTPVSAQEAAKMLLVAMGYDADLEKFKGDGWGGRVDAIANTKGLYKDVDVAPTTAKLDRDNAAQIVWNTLDTELVAYSYYPTGAQQWKAVAVDRENKTLLSENFGMKTAYGYMSKIAFDEKKEEYTYNFVNGKGSTNTANEKLEKIEAPDTFVPNGKMVSATDYSDLFGMKVKVLYKDNSSKTVYGMYAVDGEVMFEGLGSDLPDEDDWTTDGKIELDEKYEISQNTVNLPVIEVNQFATVKAVDDVAAYTEIKLVDADGDGKGDYIVALPYTMVEVGTVGKDFINAPGKLKFEDHNIEEGLKKGDWVKIVDDKYTPYDGKVVTKADMLTGEVGAARSNEVRIDGTWYTPAGDCEIGDFKIGESYDIVVNGKFVFNAEQVSEGTSIEDLVYVADADDTKTGLKGAVEFELYFMDGTSQVVLVSKVDGESISDGTSCIGQLYTFKVKSNKYELTALSETEDDENLAGFDGIVNAEGYDKDDEVVTGGTQDAYIADDAIVIVQTYKKGSGDSAVGENKVKFYTGADMADWKDYGSAEGVTAVAGLYENVKNLPTAKVLTFLGDEENGNSQPVSAVDENSYGYVLTKPSKIKEGDDYYWNYTVWTVDGELEIKEETTSSGSTQAKKGEVIVFKDLGNGKVEDAVEKVTTKGAIKGYNNKVVELVAADKSAIDTYNLTKDTVYMFVDHDAKEGIDGGEIATANKVYNDAGTHTGYDLNVWYLAEDDSTKDTYKDVLLLVYEVNNKI